MPKPAAAHERQHVCNICQRVLSSKSHLARHQLIHSGARGARVGALSHGPETDQPAVGPPRSRTPAAAASPVPRLGMSLFVEATGFVRVGLWVGPVCTRAG